MPQEEAAQSDLLLTQGAATTCQATGHRHIAGLRLQQAVRAHLLTETPEADPAHPLTEAAVRQATITILLPTQEVRPALTTTEVRPIQATQAERAAAEATADQAVTAEEAVVTAEGQPEAEEAAEAEHPEAEEEDKSR